MTFYSRPILCALTMLLLLPACTSRSPYDGKPAAVMTFEHLESFGVGDSADIRIVQFRSGSDLSTVNGFYFDLQSILDRYLQRRFLDRAGGDAMPVQGTDRSELQLVIDDVRASKTFEPSDNSAGKFLGVAGFDVYTVHIGLTLKRVDGLSGRTFEKSFEVGRRLRISEHSSITQREEAQLKALEALFKDLDDDVLRILGEDMKLL